MRKHCITDTHMHCVWGYDDGADSRETALEMLNTAYEQGVRRIVCTSHGGVYCTSQAEYDTQFSALKALAEAGFPDLQLCTGTEIFVSPGEEERTAQMLAEGRLHYLGSSRRAMIELNVHAPLEAQLRVMEAVMNAGVQAVVAHAERYDHFAESPAAIEALVKKGCRIQVNAYSLALERNFFILRNAQELVRRRLVHYIGSDAHRMDHRPPLYTEGVNWIYENMPEDYADQIVFGNASEFFSD